MHARTQIDAFHSCAYKSARRGVDTRGRAPTSFLHFEQHKIAYQVFDPRLRVDIVPVMNAGWQDRLLSPTRMSFQVELLR